MGAPSVFQQLFYLIFFVFWFGVVAVPVWRIVSKAGYPGVLSLLIWIPVVNIVLLWVFAFMKWPNERKVPLEYGGVPAGKSSD
ncbi:hypothetical protein OU994_22610 [Pseudoduganella sp. SL102]|uniref:hypothetical protein n=1 Tax=Pseudoduganella sp. SL102 TaxID=2995154 RepID=UPI00248AAF7B|nr:hypothetical protein [Pseudoduganella sp. SL102]WBS01079.1 hypothetical protein OU994_22610 [Pseudoduganella sp. SL102]